MSSVEGDGTLDLFSQPRDDEDPGLQAGSSETTPDESTIRIWSVSELNRTLRSSLEEAFPQVTVSGEVGNWTRARSGHCYFSLKDDQSQLRCVMWRRDAARLPMDPEVGMTIRAVGRITLYEARGELQLQVQEVEAEGKEGLWRLAFERLKGQLEEAGLLDPTRKRPIPRFPETVGVVTSPTGAALRDILTVIGRRAPWTRVLIRGAPVQGEGAAQKLAHALQTLASSGKVEVIIIGRGGGSLEDLWAFNEEPVARAIAASPIPVISAVGHETDVTISDLVADLRAPTPSAGAEAAVEDGMALKEALSRVRPRLARGLRFQLRHRETRVTESRRRLEAGIRGLLYPRRQVLEGRSTRLRPALQALLTPRRARLVNHRERLVPAMGALARPARMKTDRAGERLEQAIAGLLSRKRERLATAGGRVEALSPLATLRRGYAVALNEEGRVLRSTSSFRPGESFRLRVADGRIRCEVQSVDPDDSILSMDRGTGR